MTHERNVSAWIPYDAPDEIRIVLSAPVATLLVERLASDMGSGDWDVRSDPQRQLHYLGHCVRDLVNEMHHEWKRRDTGEPNG